MRYIILIFLIFLGITCYSQEYTFKARVIDQESREALAFVNVSFNSLQAQSDIEGRLTLISNKPISHIYFTYVGYAPYTFVNYDSLQSVTTVTIKLKKTATTLNEVIIKGTENPAHRIIKNTIENRKLNDPEKLPSFSYTSYNKMYFTIGKDSIAENDTAKSFTADTSREFQSFIKNNYLMLMESVSERKFMYPSSNNEKVLASRVSGFQNPSFTMLATQLQSFSFYKDLISLTEKVYLNPVSPNSTNKYIFIIEDTLYQERDSVFIISFRPRKGKNFEGLEGLLYINTNGFAIQNVIASPVDKEGETSIKIQQKYEKVKGAWFPVQLNTDISFGGINLNGHNVIGVARTYLSKIEINPELKRKQFNEIEVEILDDAVNKPAGFWEQYRTDSLTQKEINTYKTIDSIGKEAKIEQKLKYLDAFLSGKWPYHFINIDLMKLIDFNEYEGFRLGLGLETNKKLSKYFTIDGYGAYGFKDREIKYGTGLHLEISRLYKTRLSFAHRNDVTEAAAIDPTTNQNFLSPESYRELLVSRMDNQITYEGKFSSRFLRHFYGSIYIKDEYRRPLYDYAFLKMDDKNSYIDFYTEEAGLEMRFLFREKFMKVSHTLVSLGSKYPEVILKYYQGKITNIPGSAYTRYLTKISYSKLFRNFGKSSVTAEAALIDGDVPYGLLITGEAAYQNWHVSSKNSFRTMRMNEFLSDRYMAVFYNHNFGKLLIKTEKFQPKLNVCFSYALGTFKNLQSTHFGLSYNTLEKGYYETGLEINDLIKINFLGLGIGSYYRLGKYSFKDAKDNYTINFSVDFNF